VRCPAPFGKDPSPDGLYPNFRGSEGAGAKNGPIKNPADTRRPGETGKLGRLGCAQTPVASDKSRICRHLRSAGEGWNRPIANARNRLGSFWRVLSAAGRMGKRNQEHSPSIATMVALVLGLHPPAGVLIGRDDGRSRQFHFAGRNFRERQSQSRIPATNPSAAVSLVSSTSSVTDGWLGNGGDVIATGPEGASLLVVSTSPDSSPG